MKDFYDIWTLARRKDFDGRLLSLSIAATFERRKTSLPTDAPTGLTKAFAEDRAKRMQWDAFLRKGRMDGQRLRRSSANIRMWLLSILACLS